MRKRSTGYGRARGCAGGLCGPLHAGAGLSSPAVRVLACFCLVLAPCCAASDRFALPEGAGAGFLTRDMTPPPGAEVCEAPQWVPGQRFTLVAGSWARAEFVVSSVGPEGAALQERGGLLQRFTPSFAIASQMAPDQPETAMANDPPDPILDFPLWAGKRWSAEYALRIAGEPEALLGRASYACEAWDLVPTPAGEQRALRIVRRLARAGEENGREQVSVYWWSPTAGFFARKLEDGVLLELEEARRP